MAQIISIHAPREGGDGVFYGRFAYQSGYFNPRPPRGGRLLVVIARSVSVDISIHAPREGGDSGYQYEDLRLEVISIHAPREGGDRLLYVKISHT